MNYSETLAKNIENLNKSLHAESWTTFDRTMRRIAELLLDADRAGEAEVVDEIAQVYGSYYDAITLGRRLRLNLDATGVAWKVQAYDQIATLVGARTSRLPRDIDIRDAREKIMTCLQSANQPLINAQVAERTGLHVGTVARLLPELRRLGLVTSWRAGKAMYNVITEAGHRRARVATPTIDSEGRNDALGPKKTGDPRPTVFEFTKETDLSRLIKTNDLVEKTDELTPASKIVFKPRGGPVPLELKQPSSIDGVADYGLIGGRHDKGQARSISLIEPLGKFDLPSDDAIIAKTVKLQPSFELMKG